MEPCTTLGALPPDVVDYKAAINGFRQMQACRAATGKIDWLLCALLAGEANRAASSELCCPTPTLTLPLPPTRTLILSQVSQYPSVIKDSPAL